MQQDGARVEHERAARGTATPARYHPMQKQGQSSERLPHQARPRQTSNPESKKDSDPSLDWTRLESEQQTALTIQSCSTSHRLRRYLGLPVRALVNLAQEMSAADEILGLVGPVEYALEHPPVLPADRCV